MSPHWIPIVGCLVPIVIVPTAMAMKHLHRKREWEHLERMKALEMGHPLPGSTTWPSLAAIAIGAGVPAASFFFAWMTRLTAHAADAIFIAPLLVSVIAVPVGARLANSLASRGAALPNHFAHGKPAFDPDAYDVAGRRG